MSEVELSVEKAEERAEWLKADVGARPEKFDVVEVGERTMVVVMG